MIRSIVTGFLREDVEKCLGLARLEFPVHHEENPPVRREENGVGDAGRRDAEGAREVAEARAEEKDRVAARVVAQEDPGGGGGSGDGDAHHDRPAGRETGCEGLKASPLLEAGSAPGGPEVHEEGFSPREPCPRREGKEGVAAEVDPSPRRGATRPEGTEDGDLGGALEKEEAEDPGHESRGEPATQEEGPAGCHGRLPPPSGSAPRTPSAQAA